MVTAILREASCERGGRAAILVQYDSIFIEIALLMEACSLDLLCVSGKWDTYRIGTPPSPGIERA